MEAQSTQILTPDQRLRVFVSSTLQELAEERAAVRRAIENMHLIPVMFEMGARSHAPRHLYRQYLSQSHVFIGIYWERYGWVAPGEQVSGLEDEYQLSGELPRLVYIKKTNGSRDERLTQLLHRIQADDQVSYKSFETPDELQHLILNDLAILLTERFRSGNQTQVMEHEGKSYEPLPSVPNSLIGREKHVQEILDMYKEPSHRLVTLVGPGGIGKTRLAIETAGRMKDDFPDGIAFVSLSPVKDSLLVPESICYALGIKVSGGNSVESLKLFLRSKKILLVLDNFEQVIDAASMIDDLLYAAPGLRIMVTSRERLILSFEHVYLVPALKISCKNFEEGKSDKLPAAVKLFVERAQAIQPSFRITPENKEIICEIGKKLEGLPLAIELAAGQINLFTPEMLLRKLDHSLDILKGSFRDIPDRQKTMRNTIAWSFDLLSAAERKLMMQLSLYHAGCRLDAVECMEGAPDEEIYFTLNALINKSLLIRQEEGQHARFQMLESVREFAMEKMQEAGLLEEYLQKQAEYYHGSLKDMKLERHQSRQSQVLLLLEKEHPNIRQTLDFLLQKKDFARMTDIAWNLWLFWWINAHTREGYLWLKKIWDHQKEHPQQMDEYTFALLACNVGVMSFMQRDIITFKESLVNNIDLITRQQDDELVATSMLICGVVKTVMKEYATANQMLDVSLEKFQKLGMSTGVSFALSGLGRNAMYDGNRTNEAKEYYQEGIRIARKENDKISVIVALAGYALCEVIEKNPHAKESLRECIRLSQEIHFYEAIAWTMEIWSLASLNESNPLRAIKLMSAVDQLRATTHLPVWEDLQEIIHHAKDMVRQQMDIKVFDDAWKEGAAMSIDTVIEYAIAA